MPLDTPNAPMTPNATLCPTTSTTTDDYLDALHAASMMSGGYDVAEGVDAPRGPENPYRFLLLIPGPTFRLPQFRLDRGPKGVDVLAIMTDVAPMDEWTEHLGTFPTMVAALARVAEGHEHVGEEAAG